MDAIERRRRLAEIRSQAQALNEAETFGEEQQTQFDALMDEARMHKAWLDRNDQVTALPGREDTTSTREQSDGSQAPVFHRRHTTDTPEAIFCRYLRTNDLAAAAELGQHEQRAYNNTDMNVGTSADGGYAVPTGMVREILARRDEMMLAPKLGVRRVPGVGTTVNYPLDAETDVLFTAVNEAASINQDAPALGVKAFTLVKYGKYLSLSWEVLRDEDANLLAFIGDWVARGWAATHNSLLVTEVLANGTAGLTLDGAAAITAAEVPELVGKVLPEYQDGSQWLMHPTTKAYLEGFTGNNFQFAPTPGAPLGANTLWGYPNNATSYMTAYGAGVKSMVFGNFNFMGMRDVTNLTALRDPYTAATSGQVRLIYWFDAVYGVLQAEALQYATHPTA